MTGHPAMGVAEDRQGPLALRHVANVRRAVSAAVSTGRPEEDAAAMTVDAGAVTEKVDVVMEKVDVVMEKVDVVMEKVDVVMEKVDAAAECAT